MCIRDRSNVIRITVRSAGPNKAVDLANTLADSYLSDQLEAVSYTHLRAHETVLDLVCRLLLEKKKT